MGWTDEGIVHTLGSHLDRTHTYMIQSLLSRCRSGRPRGKE